MTAVTINTLMSLVKDGNRNNVSNVRLLIIEWV